MTAFESDRLPAELPDLLIEIAAPQLPDYTDQVLAITARTRQRPRWTFLERWLPMIVARQRLALPTIPWRPILAVLLIVAVLAAALYVASTQRRIPAPFGPARNGALVYERAGDLFIRDSLDAPERLLVGGSAEDIAPAFTRDGRHLTFLRRTAGSQGSPDERLDAFLADLGGSNPVDVTGPLKAPNGADPSPDDSTLVAIELRSEIVRGFILDGSKVRTGIFAARPDGSGLRPLTPTDGSVDGYQQPLLSSDGRLLTYTMWAPPRFQVHIRDLGSGTDRTITSPGVDEAYASFSPDGTRITFVRYTQASDQIMLMPVAPGAEAIAAGPPYPQVDGQWISSAFSPDGRFVMVNDQASKETRIVDSVSGGMGDVVPWAAGGFVWQRLAP